MAIWVPRHIKWRGRSEQMCLWLANKEELFFSQFDRFSYRRSSSFFKITFSFRTSHYHLKFKILVYYRSHVWIAGIISYPTVMEMFLWQKFCHRTHRIVGHMVHVTWRYFEIMELHKSFTMQPTQFVPIDLIGHANHVIRHVSYLNLFLTKWWQNKMARFAYRLSFRSR